MPSASYLHVCLGALQEQDGTAVQQQWQLHGQDPPATSTQVT